MNLLSYALSNIFEITIERETSTLLLLSAVDLVLSTSSLISNNNK
jgi:hypothetical protein